MELSEETWKFLRAPLPPGRVKWKIQENPKGDLRVEVQPSGREIEVGEALVVAYIDARDVMDKLDEAAPGAWSTYFTISGPGPSNSEDREINVECQLHIGGICRSDVGTGSAYKDAYSDALKRAAVQFGIGRFLYQFPHTKAKAMKYGKYFYLTRDAEQELLVLTENILAGAERLPRFEHIKVNHYVPLGGLS